MHQRASGFINAVSVLVVFGAVSQSHARPWRPGQIPNGFIHSCGSCHVNPRGGGPRTGFGQAVSQLVPRGGRQTFWGPDLAALDSDGDGISNGAELLDPDGLWSVGAPAPGDRSKVTNPGDPNDPEVPSLSQFRRADFNADGQINIADAIGTLNFLFVGGTPPPCEKAADANGDASVNISDATYALSFLFSGGAAPPAPSPDCGVEPTDSSTPLSCELEECV